MARPHPVVRFTSELAYRGRWRTYETDVAIYFIDNEIENIRIIESGHLYLASRIVILCYFHEVFPRGGHGFVSELFGIGAVLVLFEGGLACLVQQGGHVGHPLEERDGKPIDRQLVLVGHCPVSVLEVVVLRCAELLDAAVSAMMVGHQETLV